MLIARFRIMHDLLQTLEQIGPVEADRLENEPIPRLAVERALTQLIELAVDIGQHILVATESRAALSYGEVFPMLDRAGVLQQPTSRELEHAAGLRNVLVHQYIDIDYSRVTVGVTRAPTLFRAFIHECSAWLSQQDTT